MLRTLVDGQQRDGDRWIVDAVMWLEFARRPSYNTARQQNWMVLLKLSNKIRVCDG